MKRWYEDDAFWVGTGPAMFTEDRWAQAATDVDGVLAATGVTAGARILDLGCGVGRHTLEFARRGFKMTAVDRTSAYLDEARKRAQAESLEVEWVHADMREFRRDSEFDLVVNLLTSFGYFEDPADDRRTAENIFAALKPGGQFVLEIMGKEVLARMFRPFDWHRLADGTLFLEERKLRDAWDRLDVRWILIKEDKRREYEFTLRLFAASDLKKLLLDVGFGRADAFGSLDKKPYDHDAERLVIVAGK